MKSFRQYYQQRSEACADLESDEILNNIAQMAVMRHRDAIVELFRSLARKDEQIAEELKKYRDQGAVSNKPDSDKEADIVVPAAADTINPV
jgi:hypothetical protein